MKKGSKFDDFLKDENIEIDEEIIKENAELKAEIERLKKENKTLEQFLSKEPLVLQALQKGYASYKESTDVFYQMVKTYKQTLQEIKKLAEVGQDKYHNGLILAKPILDLITKAEEV